MSISNLTSVQLRHAASIIEQIGKLQTELNQLAGAKVAGPVIALAATKPAKQRKKISAAGIARIRAGQKARWARVHAAKGR
jgi:hypothetical protein